MALAIRGTDAGPGIEQLADDLGLPGAQRGKQRALLADRMRIGGHAGLEQRPQRDQIAARRGQPGHAMPGMILRRGLCAPLQQQRETADRMRVQRGPDQRVALRQTQVHVASRRKQLLDG